MKKLEISIMKQLKEHTCLLIRNCSSQRMIVKLLVYKLIVVEANEDVLKDLPTDIKFEDLEVINLNKERRIPP